MAYNPACSPYLEAPKLVVETDRKTDDYHTTWSVSLGRSPRFHRSPELGSCPQ